MKVITSLGSTFVNKSCEFEIQSFLYTELKGKYPVVRGECHIKMGKGKGSTILRPDILVAEKSGKVLFTVEVKHKKPEQGSATARKNREQREKYEKFFMAPCYLVCGWNEAKKFATWPHCPS